MGYTGRAPGLAMGVQRLTDPVEITLSGDANGSISIDGTEDVVLSVGVQDDSHNHIISNVDGLQAALDAKAPLASPALTGTPTAPTAALGSNTTQIATTAFVKTEVANLIDAAPTALDTLNELAAALGDDANYATTVTTALSTKVAKVTSTDNAIVRFDGTSGAVQNSGAILDDSGNLGLGVTPSAWNRGPGPVLQVNYASIFQDGGYDVTSFGTNVYYSGGYKYIGAGPAAATLYKQYSDQHQWYTAPSGTAGNPITFTQAMTLDASGNLLVGGTSNSFSSRIYSLETSATEKNNVALYTTGAHNTTRIGLYNDIGAASVQSIGGALSFSSGGVGSGAERMRLDSSGNLGLGVTPSAWAGFTGFDLNTYGGLHAFTNMTGLAGNAYFNSGWKYKQATLASRYELSGGAHAWYTAPSGTAGNPITFTQAMTLDASGNLLVGTTSAITSGLTVFGSSSGALSGTYNSRNTTMTSGRSWNFGGAQGDGFIIYGNNSGSFVSGVSLSWGGNSWVSQSDERTKEIIKPISGALEGVMLLRTVIGRYKTDDENRRRPFLIAQDVQIPFPEVVTEQSDEQKTLGIEYANMIPFLTAAIQEQQAMITELKARIEQLENK